MVTYREPGELTGRKVLVHSGPYRGDWTIGYRISASGPEYWLYSIERPGAMCHGFFGDDIHAPYKRTPATLIDEAIELLETWEDNNG